MALSPNEQTIASGGDDGKVRLLDVDTTTVITNWTGHTRIVYASCWSADGERVVSGNWDGTARICDVNSGTTTMRGHTDWVNGAVFLPDGEHIITGSLDNSLRLWNIQSGAQIGEEWRDENGAVLVWSMALSPNGKTVASGGGRDDCSVRLWDVETRKVISKWRGHTDVVCALGWNADSERVASGSWDGTARVWDVNRGKTI
ncbi:quinon protein alcohol dehydrogenase-like superfamily, partial [Suillus americanus]